MELIKKKARICVGVCALVCTISNYQNDVVLTGLRIKKITGYSHDFLVDSHVVLRPSCGAAGTYGF
jgi:hypothetical protein